MKHQKLLITETFVLNFELASVELGKGSGEFTIDVEINTDENAKSGAFTPFFFGGKFDEEEVFASAQGDDFSYPYIELTSISKTGLATMTFSEEFVPVEDISTLSTKEFFFKGEELSAIEIFINPIEG